MPVNNNGNHFLKHIPGSLPYQFRYLPALFACTTVFQRLLTIIDEELLAKVVAIYAGQALKTTK